MFFRPNFCCNCGERIQRAEWKLLTSRRFCDVCAIERQGTEWFPRAIVAGGVLIGVFGAGNYLRTAEAPATAVPFRAVEGPQVRQVMSAPTGGDLRSQGPAAELPEAARPDKDSTSFPNGPAVERQVGPADSASQGYFCGALTKKGKPCSRRVKTKTRCWQHQGQPHVSEIARETEFY
ncbi:MAG: hypothetical protein IPM25_05895 [Chloracidobacterium sp.]|nr:hypothetical protein [Chloracidobacterium sp.]